jgi:glyceraldehyde-3-phosphate dehydrogenase/erythrose-4-phosphate dehydrogenase
MVKKIIIQFVIRRIPWKENNIDVVIESTGFTASEDAKKHKAGPNR